MNVYKIFLHVGQLIFVIWLLLISIQIFQTCRVSFDSKLLNTHIWVDSTSFDPSWPLTVISGAIAPNKPITNLPIEPVFPGQNQDEDKYGLKATMNQIHEIILDKIEEVTQGRCRKLFLGRKVNFHRFWNCLINGLKWQLVSWPRWLQTWACQKSKWCPGKIFTNSHWIFSDIQKQIKILNKQQRISFNQATDELLALIQSLPF